jgi:hypothetical protein
LKEEARIALRQAAREGDEPTEDRRRALAEKLAPRDEDELFAMARHTPQLRPAVREGVLAALARVLVEEAAAIAKGGADYLELQDRDRCCGG